MSSIITPNMALTVPGVGTEAGPQYATEINQDLVTLDSHDHTAGKGLPIVPAAIDINTALTFQNNFATNVAGITLLPQGATPSINTVYESGVDLFYVDGNGNNVQLTANGGVAGSPGNITGLTAPASVSYISASSTFIFQSDTNIAANLDGGSVLLRNITPNSTNAVTLSPPANLSSSFTLTLPTLPVANSFLTMNTIGQITGSIPTSAGLGTSNFPAGFQFPLANAAVTSATTVAPQTQFLTADSTSAPFAITIYTAVGNAGREIFIKKISADMNAITVTPQSGQTIEFQSSYALFTQGEAILLISDGINWYVQDHQATTPWSAPVATIISSTGTFPTKGTTGQDQMIWRRIGNSAEVKVVYAQTGAGSPGSGDGLFQLPPGLVFDSSVTAFSAVIIGNNVINALGVDTYPGGYIGFSGQTAAAVILPFDTTHYRIYVTPTFGVANASNSFYYNTTAFGYSLKFVVPIAGWNA